jgi:Leucine-rich repeat (LRR) protein
MKRNLLAISVLLSLMMAVQNYNTEGSLKERDILVDLFNSTNGSGWASNKGWMSSNSVCTWQYVRCDEANSIVELTLETNQLSGTIPSSLGQLTNLRSFDLYNNKLSGTIPSSLGQLTNLRLLTLETNQLSGTIPSSLGQLTNLTWLHLDYNQLSGISTVLKLPNLDLLHCSMSKNPFNCPIPVWAEKRCGGVCH